MAQKSKKGPTPSKYAKGPMSVNKADTPPWMRLVVIIVVASFALGGVAIVVGAATSGPTGGVSGDATSTVSSEFQSRVQSAQAAMDASPNNPDVIAQVGHAYYEWAVSLYEGQQVQASIPLWKSAVSYYDQALAIRPDDDVLLGNKAFALFYAGETELAKEAILVFVEAAEDNARLTQQVDNARRMLTQLESAPATTTP